MQPRSFRSVSWLLLVGVLVAVVTGALVRHAATRGEQLPGELKGPWRDRSGAILLDGTDRGEDFALGVRVYQGLEHCEWERATFMEVAWPPGSIPTLPYGEVRQFVRDPHGVLDHPPVLRGDFTRDIEPPADAEPTGVRTDEVEIWFGTSNENGLYLRHSDGTFDLWPRAEPRIGCA
jgi:hypothetical protein